MLTTLLARGSLCGWTRKAYAYKFRQLLALTLKSGVLASLSGNSGMRGYSPLLQGSRHTPRKVTLGPLAGVALFAMTECWLDFELQITGAKKARPAALAF